MDVKDLLKKVAAEEARHEGARVIAPVAPGGRVRARVAGLVQSLAPEPAGFEGIGLFRLAGERAVLVERASEAERARYLSAFAQLSLILVRRLEGQSWAALPADAGDFAQRVGPPVVQRVHLVARGEALDVVKAAWDGASLWWAGPDPRFDPREAEALRRALGRGADYPAPPGRGPELARAWRAAGSGAAPAAYAARRRDRAQIEAALEEVGGALREFRDEGAGWQVEWVDEGGRRRASWIDKEDPRVEGFAASVDARRREVDLGSLRGLVERACLTGEAVDFE